MKIDNNTRFPYPVLSDATGDYKTGNFSISAIVEERPANGKLKIEYTVNITEKRILLEVENKVATVGLFVTCLDTYFNELIGLGSMHGYIEFAPGALKGRVALRPLIWATKDIHGYFNDNLHDDYGGVMWDFHTGSVLAIGNELIVNVGHEKLAPMESIFSLAINRDIPEGEIKVQSDSDRITIHCGQDTYQTMAYLRGTKLGQSILLNSVYLPAVMEVLSQLGDSDTGLSGKKWYKVFIAKCEHLNINYSNGDLLEDAQKLLKFPVAKIKSIAESLL